MRKAIVIILFLLMANYVQAAMFVPSSSLDLSDMPSSICSNELVKGNGSAYICGPKVGTTFTDTKLCSYSTSNGLECNTSSGGDVIGPATNTDGYIPQWNGANSKTLKDGVMLDTDNTLAANSDSRIPSQKGIKNYVDSAAAAAFGWANPLSSYNASGAGDTTTTGTISNGSNSLTSVGSNAGWAENMGISVTGAGTAGALLNCPYIHIVSSSNFTLWNDSSHTSACNAATSVTGSTVSHDDTQALINAIASGKNVHIPRGIYNVTGELALNSGTIISDAIYTGAGRNIKFQYVIVEGEGALSTVIQNRGTTNNVFAVHTAAVVLRDMMIKQASGITPTAGYAIAMGDSTYEIIGNRVYNIDILNTYNGISTGPYMIQNFFYASRITGTNGNSIYINNPVPFGDTHWTDIEILALGGINIVAADTQNFTNLKINAASPSLTINPTAGNIYNLRFVNCSFENSSSPSILVGTSRNGSYVVQGTQFVGGELLQSATSFSIGSYARGTMIFGMNLGDGGVISDSGESTMQMGNSSTAGSTYPYAYASQYAAKKFTTTTTLDWNKSNVQYIQLANGAQTFTFANPQDGGRYMIILKQPSSSSAGTVTWPSEVLWSGGSAPILTSTNDKVDVITFIYDGTNTKYYGGSSLNY